MNNNITNEELVNIIEALAGGSLTSSELKDGKTIEAIDLLIKTAEKASEVVYGVCHG